MTSQTSLEFGCPRRLSRTRLALLLALTLASGLGMSGCGGAYIAAIIIATQSDSSTTIDTTKPDLQVTNLQAPPVATIVAITSATETDVRGSSLELFDPVSVRVLNAGNDVAPPGYNVSLFLSRTKVIDNNSIRFRRKLVNVTTQTAEFTRVELDNTDNLLATTLEGLPATIAAGSYFMLARVGGADELAEGTNNNDTLAVGQLRVFDPRASANDDFPARIPSEMDTSLNQTGSPNLVLERVFVPSFAFARDSVNANQQQVAGERVTNVSVQVALRGAALAAEQPVELRLFLSTDQELSGDDQSLASTSGQPLSFVFPATAAGTVRTFSNFTVFLPQVSQFSVGLPQTFFILGQLVPLPPPGGSPQELTRDAYDNVRPADIRTRVYGRFLQSGKAILPDLTVDSPIRTDPDALEFTTTAFSIPTPGSQRIFSFQIPDVANINPDESQVLVLLQSNEFDPVLELLSPVGNTLRASDDSEGGQAGFLTASLSAAGAGNNVFYVVISSRSGTGSGSFNLTIFLQSRTDPTRSVILPVNLGNLLSLDRGRATLTSAAQFPVNLTNNSSFEIQVDGQTNIPILFQNGGPIADLSQATAEEIRVAIQNQADSFGAFVDVQVDAIGRILISSVSVGNQSSLKITDGAGTPAATLGLPVGEAGVSEGNVVFNFRADQPDTQFIFFVPERGAFQIVSEPSLDIFGGVTASLQFFSGASQRAIVTEKSSDSNLSTTFRAPGNAPLVLDKGYYSLIINAPQPIPNVDFRLQFQMKFDRTVNPQ